MKLKPAIPSQALEAAAWTDAGDLGLGAARERRRRAKEKRREESRSIVENLT
jgi:hypothetical protein